MNSSPPWPSGIWDFTAECPIMVSHDLTFISANGYNGYHSSEDQDSDEASVSSTYAVHRLSSDSTQPELGFRSP